MLRSDGGGRHKPESDSGCCERRGFPNNQRTSLYKVSIRFVQGGRWGGEEAGGGRWGLAAEERIPAGQAVLEIVGNLITEQEANAATQQDRVSDPSLRHWRSRPLPALSRLRQS